MTLNLRSCMKPKSKFDKEQAFRVSSFKLLEVWDGQCYLTVLSMHTLPCVNRIRIVGRGNPPCSRHGNSHAAERPEYKREQVSLRSAS